MSKLADELERLCCAETEGEFFDCAKAIRTFCRSLGAASVQVSSDGVERIYYAGISLDALSVAVALALVPPPSEAGREGSPDDIRALGWMVAVHNDYRINGDRHTFWLFTKDARALKGEGRTDSDALNQVRAALSPDPGTVAVTSTPRGTEA